MKQYLSNSWKDKKLPSALPNAFRVFQAFREVLVFLWPRTKSFWWRWKTVPQPREQCWAVLHTAGLPLVTMTLWTPRKFILPEGKLKDWMNFSEGNGPQTRQVQDECLTVVIFRSFYKVSWSIEPCFHQTAWPAVWQKLKTLGTIQILTCPSPVRSELLLTGQRSPAKSILQAKWAQGCLSCSFAEVL